MCLYDMFSKVPVESRFNLHEPSLALARVADESIPAVTLYLFFSSVASSVGTETHTIQSKQTQGNGCHSYNFNSIA